jgi:nucleotide-binding universal stress UspA family protein
MARVTVGVDGSGNARSALRWAGALATATGRDLRVVQAWQYPADLGLPTGGTQVPAPDEVEVALGRALDDLLAEEAASLPDGVTRSLRRGPAAASILAEAGRSGTDVVVVGSRGAGGLEGMVLGSVSRACLEHGKVPTLVVPPAAGDPALIGGGPVVVGHDGSAGASLACRLAGDLAGAIGAEVVLVRGFAAYDADRAQAMSDPAVEESERELRDRGVPCRTMALEDDPRHLLLRVADDVDAQLVVVGARGRSKLAKLLLGSVASYVARHSDRPVLVVPSPG